MRLTLRTLLAYLDDVLEPAQTKLIGQKIQESAVAGKLVSLIKLVVRQRRLKAPSVSGPNVGIDPNVVAQYLDNTLPPEQVVEVEKVLLTSDELLAEVASCHQVMALVMGKHVEVSQASRERLYALGPVEQGDQLKVEEPRSYAASDGVPASARETEGAKALKPAAPATDAHAEIPEYLRQHSWPQRVVPAAIVALLLLVCLGLLISDPGFLTGIREAKRELTKSERNGKSDSAIAEPAPETANGTPEAMIDEAAVPAAPAVAKVDPMPPADIPEPPDARAEPDESVPADAILAANRTLPAAVPEKVVPPAGEPSPVLNPAAVQYISNDGVVLRLDTMQQHWFLLPHRSAILPGELLAVLEPYDAVLDFDRGLMVATVMGDSAVRLLPPDRVTSTGLEIQRGRLLLRASRKDPSQRALMSIKVGKETWTVEFLSSDTVCALEIAPREPIQFEKPLGQDWYVGVLRVLSGSVKWTSEGGKPLPVAAQTALEITPSGQPQPMPVSSAFAPDWTDLQKRKQAPLRRFATLFEKEFEPDQPVEMNLLALIKDSNAKIVELAVHGLALTESIPALVQALAECNFEEGRFAASDGLRIWLGREPDRGKVLKELLAQRYSATEANAAYLLLWGFRPEDGGNRAMSLELVNWLRSTHVGIRELAYYWVVRLSGRKWEFRAADVPARRESAIRKIEAHIMAVGALSKPTDVGGSAIQ